MYGRKNGGTWHRVETRSHRAFCNQRIQATQTTDERPDSNLCQRCCPGGPAVAANVCHVSTTAAPTENGLVSFILGQTNN
jgi:hypothetical protein